jgi:uncharacterized protein (DUF2141 family)
MSVSATTRLRIAGLTAALLVAAPVVAQAGPVNVTVSGIRNADGIIRCGLYNSPAGFREPGREMMGATGTISGGRATCAFRSVPPGTYAVAVFHAERGERNVETGMFGKPKQGVGFSNNPSIAFGPPNFNAAAFKVGNDPVNLSVRLSY